MCGRMDVDGDMVNQWVPETLGIPFETSTNHDLRPTQKVATVAAVDGGQGQLDTT